MCRLPKVVAACSSFLCELAEERCTDLVSTLADLDGDDRHAAGTCVPAYNFRPLFVTTRSFACRVVIASSMQHVMRRQLPNVVRRHQQLWRSLSSEKDYAVVASTTHSTTWERQQPPSWLHAASFGQRSWRTQHLGSRLHARCNTTLATDEPAAASTSGADEEPESARVYEGALAVTVRRVKLLSLSSLVATVAGAPLLVHLSSPDSVTVGAKFLITATLVTFGVFTTALLSWFASPYVIRLEINGDTVTATTLNLLAKQTTRTFRIAEMGEARTMRPLATFEAQGQVFFIDGNTADERLLNKLGLKKAQIKPSEEQADDDD
jgi:hypothetical protein